MAINTCIFTDGKPYTPVEESFAGQCTDCSFRNDYKKCSESTQYVNCLTKRIIWKPLQEEPMKSITQEIKDFNPESFVVKQLPSITTQLAGTKYDSDKLQYTLIPPHALMEVARNLTIGLKKYKERDNWKKVPNASQRYLDALYRHLEAHRRGEVYDPESSEPNMYHMSAVIVNAMFILEFLTNEKLTENKI